MLEESVNPNQYFLELQAAFREGGFDVLDGDLEEQAEHIQGSTINDALVTALDHWAGWQTGTPAGEHLTRLASLSDPSPTRWEYAARDPGLWQKVDDFNRLRDVAWEEVSPSLILQLAERLRRLGGDPRPLLKRAQLAHPDDFWINSMLGGLIMGQSLGLKKEPLIASEAIGYLRAALAARPKSHAAQSNLALALSSSGEYGEAIHLLEDARRLAPQHYRVHLNLGVILDESGASHRAIAAYKEALRFNSRSSTTHYRLGVALRNLKRFQEAAAAFQNSIDLEPQHADAWSGLGTALLLQEDWQGAAKALRQALAIDPQMPETCGNLSIALRNAGDFEGAIAAARTSVQIRRDRKSLMILSRALKAGGLSDEAHTVESEADSMSP